jgi:hypothetical protein
MSNLFMTFLSPVIYYKPRDCLLLRRLEESKENLLKMLRLLVTEKLIQQSNKMLLSPKRIPRQNEKILPYFKGKKRKIFFHKCHKFSCLKHDIPNCEDCVKSQKDWVKLLNL